MLLSKLQTLSHVPAHPAQQRPNAHFAAEDTGSEGEVACISAPMIIR